MGLIIVVKFRRAIIFSLYKNHSAAMPFLAHWAVSFYHLQALIPLRSGQGPRFILSFP